MRPQKVHRIDLTSEYPCPCRRNGRLKPIVLTEALGCDRCQQIFAVKKDGQVIEQLASIYQKKSWRWVGNRWKNNYGVWQRNSLSIILLSLLSLGIVMVVIVPQMLRWLNAQSMISWIVVFLLMLLGLSLFIFYRH
ncbi:MAG: hypothetical protein AAFQ41_03780 [Cyanobacteria bacterium J06623_7]